ncbi:hypothetical protein YWS52_33780 [Chitiniphilus shinanonensis]
MWHSTKEQCVLAALALFAAGSAFGGYAITGGTAFSARLSPRPSNQCNASTSPFDCTYNFVPNPNYYAPSKAFDQNNGTYWLSAGENHDYCGSGQGCFYETIWDTTGYLGMTFDTYQLVDEYQITPSSTLPTAPRNWTLEGFDGIKWITLDQRSNQSSWVVNQAVSFKVPFPKYAVKYRLKITANNGGTVLQVAELRFYSPLQGTNVQPWLRYYGSGDHFYSARYDDLGTGAGVYALEGLEAYVWTAGQPGTTPIYRYYNGTDHFYTTDWSELGGGRGSYHYEGVAAYAYNYAKPGTVPLYRYYNGRDHFYTVNQGSYSGYWQEATSIWVGQTPRQPGSAPFDTTGDRLTDVAVWQPSTGQLLRYGPYPAQAWTTQPGDVAAPADFDGDGIADLAYWRPSNGNWYVTYSSNGATATRNWGSQAVGDTPVPADYDGDGKADYAVWRASTGQWFHIRSSDGGTLGPYWGTTGDKPVMGDFDGDGKADYAVWRPSTGEWLIRNSSGVPTISSTFVLGSSSDLRAPADYDGDGKTDVAVWQPSTGLWLIRLSTTGTIKQEYFGGQYGGIPVPGQYDADGKADLAIWNPSTGIWQIRYSSGQPDLVVQWGTNGDVPLAGLFIR